MLTKRALFPRANSALSLSNECRCWSETVNRIHKFLRNLYFGNLNRGFSTFWWRYKPNPRAGGEVSESVVHTQNQSWGSIHGRYEQLFQHNLSKSHSHYQGNFNSNSTWNNYRNCGSSLDSGSKTFDYSDRIEEFDEFCERDDPKMALKTMASLEKMGHVLDLARLLRLAQL